MFVLDTNVVSELMRERPSREVLGWMDNQLTDNLFVTSITEAEIRTGIAILPEGERQRGLATAAERLFGVFFAERILPFDSDAAQAYAMLAAERRGCRTTHKPSRLPDRRHRTLPRGAGRNPGRGRLRRVRARCHQPLGGRMSAPLTNVTIKLNARSEAASYLTLLQGEDHKSLNVNVGEVIALALHGGLPIYLDTSDHDGGPGESTHEEAAVPHAFESLLSDLARTDHHDAA